jgi:hypothetical protein
MYVGTVDGTTPYGTVIKWGTTNLFDTPPTVAADTNCHTLATDNSPAQRQVQAGAPESNFLSAVPFAPGLVSLAAFDVAQAHAPSL